MDSNGLPPGGARTKPASRRARRTDREKQIEILLRETERRLKAAEEIANLGSWEWNIATGQLWWSEQIYAIFGVRPEDVMLTYETFLKFVHPDDRMKVCKAVEAALAGQTPYNIVHRIVLPDGALRYVSEQARLVYDKAGKPVRLAGTIQDITERHVASIALQNSETRLATIIDIAPEAVIATNADGVIQVFNRGAEGIFGYAREEVKGKHLDILIPESARAAHRAHVKAFQASSEPRRLMFGRQDVSGVRKDGSLFPASASVSKVKIGDETLFIAILQDATDAYRAEAELRDALEQAKSANMAKSQFLATMSHELRTPLNAIMGFAEVFSHQFLGPLGDAKYIEYANDILRSGEHLLNLVNDLLDFSDAEQGRRTLDREWIDVDQIAMECIRIVNDKARRAGVQLSVTTSLGRAEIYADKLALKQVLLNLLSNAIKFTPRDGKVSISCYEAGEASVISVTDTGIGIAEDVLPTLAQPFHRVSQDPYHAEKGWGLGLAITKSLIEQHGGTLNICSAPGKGTEITASFPHKGQVERDNEDT